MLKKYQSSSTPSFPFALKSFEQSLDLFINFLQFSATARKMNEKETRNKNSPTKADIIRKISNILFPPLMCLN